MGTVTPPKNGQSVGQVAEASKHVIPAEALAKLDGKLLDLLPGAVYVCDHEGAVVRWNKRAVELWGREPRLGDPAERFCGSHRLYRLDGTFMAHADCPMADALRTGEAKHNVEAVIERPDQSRCFVLVNIDPIRDESGMVVGAVNIFQDITEQKQAEAALRQSERRFRRLLDNLPAGGYTCDAHGYITYFNRRAVELWGREPKLNDPVDRYCGSFKLFSTDGSPIVHEQCWMALALRDRRDYNGQEIVVERPDGTRRIALAHANPFHDEAGNVIGAVNILVDVTAHREAEWALNRSEAQLRLVTDHAPVLLVHCDREARFIFVNKPYADRLGLTPQDIIGKRIPDVIGEAAYASFRQYVERTLTGQHVEFEVEIPYEKIGPHVMRCACAPDFGPDGQVRGLVAVLADVTERKRAEEALRESEQRFARFMQHLPGLAWIKDTQGRYVYVNDAAEKAFRTPRAVLYGKTDNEVFPPEVAARFSLNDRQAVASGSGIQVVETLEHDDGTLHYSLVTKFPIQAPDGEAAFVGGMAIDITDQRRAEEEMRHSEERFRSLMEQAPFSIQVFSPDGRTIRVNRAWEELWGVRFEQIEGYNVLEDRQLESKGVLQYIRQGFAGQATRIPAIQYNPNDTIPGVTEEADPRRWLSAVIYPLKDAEGRVREVALIHEDITARQRAEEALRKSERLYRAIGESIEYGVWVCDPLGRNTYASDSFLRMVGLTQEQCSEFGWGDVLHPDDAGRTLAAWKECARTGGQWDIEHRFRGADGQWHPVLARGVPVKNERGEITAWAGINLDISRLKRVEDELREADRRKDEFLATLAHELRNPLAPIRNSLQILKMSRVDAATIQQTRDMMERQVDHLVRLVDDLLDVSRVMRGKIELRREPVELATVVARAVETAQPLIEVQGHQLEIAVPSESLLLSADPVRLAQVVGNLLTNAAKYTEANGRIWLKAEREDGRAVLRVRDNGIGIAPDVLPHVFDLFMQVDHAAARSQGGLGIGLTLVKNLVEMHGGTVEAHSEGLGRGCEFVVRLPLRIQERKQPVDEGNGERLREPAPTSGHRLLVVDDNKDAALSLAMLLRLQGHDVRVAHDGVSALQIAATFGPQVVFLDLGMPRMDGYEVARRLREQPGLEGVVLAALTGWGQQEDRRRTADAGFSHHLVKPPEPKAVEDILDRLPKPQ
jgi:PAS domain S-box-containing protein